MNININETTETQKYIANYKCKLGRLGLSAILAIFLTSTVVLGMEAAQRQHLLGMQESLAEQVLRFHVLANSDSDEDQALKLKVKDAVIDYMKTSMNTVSNTSNTNNISNTSETDCSQQQDLLATKVWVENHRSQITDICQTIIVNEGYDYPVTVDLTESHFPVKTYGDITFPKGDYEALKIQIGEAKGQNWWCCLYPKLCFIDATYGVVSEEGKEDLQEVLTDEEYNMITTTSKVKIKWFFFGR